MVLKSPQCTTPPTHTHTSVSHAWQQSPPCVEVLGEWAVTVCHLEGLVSRHRWLLGQS